MRNRVFQTKLNYHFDTKELKLFHLRHMYIEVEEQQEFKMKV